MPDRSWYKTSAKISPMSDVFAIVFLAKNRWTREVKYTVKVVDGENFLEDVRAIGHFYSINDINPLKVN